MTGQSEHHFHLHSSKRDLSKLVLETGNLGDLTDRDKDPDKVALIDATAFDAPLELTHGEVDRRSNAVARALLARGLQRGERVAILSSNSADYLIAYFGTMRAGLVSVPVNWRFPTETITYIMTDCDAKLVFADAARVPLCQTSQTSHRTQTANQS